MEHRCTRPRISILISFFCHKSLEKIESAPPILLLFLLSFYIEADMGGATNGKRVLVQQFR